MCVCGGGGGVFQNDTPTLKMRVRYGIPSLLLLTSICQTLSGYVDKNYNTANFVSGENNSN